MKIFFIVIFVLCLIVLVVSSVLQDRSLFVWPGQKRKSISKPQLIIGLIMAVSLVSTLVLIALDL